MRLDSSFAGVRSKPFTVEITARQSMNYAAATGDNNPYYFDDEGAKGTIAPPMLAVALTSRPSLHFEEYWRIPGFPREVMAYQVHYTESLRWRRPLKPGDALTICGEIAAMEQRRGGTYLLICYEAMDERGVEVFTEFVGALFRHVELSGGARYTRTLPEPVSDGMGNDVRWEEQIPIDPLAAHVYDGCADISFPIHTSRVLARAVGLPGPILHGTATLAIALRELVNREAEGDPRRVAAADASFTGYVTPGSNIAVRCGSRSRRGDAVSVAFEVVNAAGKRAISDGRLILHEVS